MLRLLSGIIPHGRHQSGQGVNQTKHVPSLPGAVQYMQGRVVWQISAASGVATASRAGASIRSTIQPEIAVGATNQNWRVWLLTNE